VPLSADYRRKFDREHGRLYGYTNPQRPVEVVSVRVRAAGLTRKPPLPFARSRRSFKPKPAGVRSGRFNGRDVRMSFYRWPDLAPGAAGRGPAVITGAEATIVAPPGFGFHLDGYSNIVLKNFEVRTSKFEVKS
jgi:N-methylhydantoinase A